jgi:hypothetical protein
MGFLASIKQVGKGLVYIEPMSPVDPGFGGGRPGGGDPGYDRPNWGGGRPDNELPEGPVDPGFGGGIGAGGDPGYDRPSWGSGRPDNTLPGGGGARPTPPIVVPYPPEIQPPPEKPIVVPKPKLPPGSLIAVPLPSHVPVPAPTTPVTPGSVPYVVWGGPGTDSKLVYLTPPETAAPK